MLLEAWTQRRAARRRRARAAWAPAGRRDPRASPRTAPERGRHALGALAPERLREVYAARDVLVVPSIATPQLPRAVGAGGQRGDEPGACGDRQRRGRRRRRRAGARRRQRPRRARRRPAARSRGRSSASARDSALRARLGAAGGATCRVHPRAWAAGFSRALQREGLPRALASVGASSMSSSRRRQPTRRLHRKLALRAGSVGQRRMSVGEQIILRCTHGQSLSGFSQSAYRQALKELSADAEEYSRCAQQIRQAQLAAARRATERRGGRAPRRRSPPRRPTAGAQARPAAGSGPVSGRRPGDQPGRRARERRLRLQHAAGAAAGGARADARRACSRSPSASPASVSVPGATAEPLRRRPRRAAPARATRRRDRRARGRRAWRAARRDRVGRRCWSRALLCLVDLLRQGRA